MRKFFRNIFAKANTGPWPFIITFGLLIVGAILVYNSPRSLFAFLILMCCPLALYFLKMDNKVKLLIGLLLTVVIIPVLGIRNIFYLEVIFQISVFAALALGLNIVVGMAGLLDLGYVAFYAVGAYSWAIFGSKQLSLLHSVPGAAAANAPFALDPRWFWLFLFLGVGLAALTGILLGLPVLRLRGDYLAIVTLGFGELVRALVNNLDKPINLTNGPKGIAPISKPPLFFKPVLEFFGLQVADAALYPLYFYALVLLLVFVIILVTRRLESSRVGRAWKAI